MTQGVAGAPVAMGSSVCICRGFLTLRLYPEVAGPQHLGVTCGYALLPSAPVFCEHPGPHILLGSAHLASSWPAALKPG